MRTTPPLPPFLEPSHAHVLSEICLRWLWEEAPIAHASRIVALQSAGGIAPSANT